MANAIAKVTTFRVDRLVRLRWWVEMEIIALDKSPAIALTIAEARALAADLLAMAQEAEDRLKEEAR